MLSKYYSGVQQYQDDYHPSVSLLIALIYAPTGRCTFQICRGICPEAAGGRRLLTQAGASRLLRKRKLRLGLA